jgi:magnesium-protoporphyrin O-methyltransferase
MTCSHCLDANNFFDTKAARKELKTYLKKGVTNPTKKLVDLLKEKNIQGSSLLDIGGGIGAIQFELYKEGIAKSTDVDASDAYLQVVKDQANERQIIDKMNFVKGDFMDVAGQVGMHDLVTLDKVICCYPNAKQLLTASLEKCNKFYGLIYPLDGIIANIAIFFARMYFKIIKSSFRPYIHSHKEVNQHIVLKGFVKRHEALAFPWKIYVYERAGD